MSDSTREVVRAIAAKCVSAAERDDLFARLDGHKRDEDGTIRSGSGNRVRYDATGTGTEVDDEGRPVTSRAAAPAAKKTTVKKKTAAKKKTGRKR